MEPCYPLADLQALAQRGDFMFANQRAQKNARELDWTSERICAFICGLKSRHHRGVRSQLSIFNGRGAIDVDKYGARFDEETDRITIDHGCCEFFVELAIQTLPNGVVVLIVSFHLDGQP